MSRIEPLTSQPASDGVYSLVYTSTATTPFSPDDLAELLRTSRASNAERDITGLLLHRKGRFTQFLEGDEAEVRALLERIETDERHTGIRVLIDGYAERRQLPDWTMGYEPVAESATPPPEGFRDTFDDLDGAGGDDAVLRALRELTLWFRVRAARPGTPPGNS